MTEKVDRGLNRVVSDQIGQGVIAVVGFGRPVLDDVEEFLV